MRGRESGGVNGIKRGEERESGGERERERERERTNRSLTTNFPLAHNSETNGKSARESKQKKSG